MIIRVLSFDILVMAYHNTRLKSRISYDTAQHCTSFLLYGRTYCFFPNTRIVWYIPPHNLKIASAIEDPSYPAFPSLHTHGYTVMNIEILPNIIPNIAIYTSSTIKTGYNYRYLVTLYHSMWSIYFFLFNETP